MYYVKFLTTWISSKVTKNTLYLVRALHVLWTWHFGRVLRIQLLPPLIQVNHSKYLYERNTVKDTRYILSFNDNEQLMLVIQNMHEVKQRARLHLQQRLVNVTCPDIWSHNRFTCPKKFQASEWPRKLIKKQLQQKDLRSEQWGLQCQQVVLVLHLTRRRSVTSLKEEIEADTEPREPAKKCYLTWWRVTLWL